MNDDDLLLPAEDRCVAAVFAGCGLPRAAHVGWVNGGPSHEYVEPEGKPRPERIVSAHIQTEWTCSHCGADCDVWGTAEEWMECPECGRYSFLVPFMNVPASSSQETK